MAAGARIPGAGSAIAAADLARGAPRIRETAGAGKGATVLGDERPDAARVFAGLPPARPDDEGLREAIRALRADGDLLLGVLDDDPTGSQAVHGVQVVTVLDEDVYAAALAGPAATCFVLTNSRSLDEPEAAAVTTRAARGLITVAGRRGTRIQLISRSDSTLRGHVMAEVAALQAVRHDLVGRGYDGVLLVPAFLEAGRVTAADIHWARTPAGLVPVGETEFAQDSAFGYSASDLRVFVAEKSGGTIRPDEVRSISLADIRLGGPARVREVLAGAAGGAWVVVNATEYSDLETVARSVLEAEREGQSFLFRTGPSFVRALSGLGPRPPLRGAQIWGAGRGAQIWGARGAAGTAWSWWARTSGRPAGRSPRCGPGVSPPTWNWTCRPCWRGGPDVAGRGRAAGGRRAGPLGRAAVHQPRRRGGPGRGGQPHDRPHRVRGPVRDRPRRAGRPARVGGRQGRDHLA